jgi:hypothetical protein
MIRACRLGGDCAARAFPERCAEFVSGSAFAKANSVVDVAMF